MWTLQVTFKKNFCHKPCKKYAGQEKLFFLKQDPGSGFKILICRIRIRPKMDRIRIPGRRVDLNIGDIGWLLWM